MEPGQINVTALKEWQTARGLSGRKLAKEAQISPSYLCKILKGTKNPQPVVALRLANALGVSLASIYAVNADWKSRFVLIDLGDVEAASA